MSAPIDVPLRSRAVLRFVVMAVIGAAVGIGVGIGTSSLPASWADGILAGWAAASLAYIVTVWVRVWRMDAEQTRDHATQEDPGRAVTEVLILFASIGSLIAVGVVIVQASVAKGFDQFLFAGFAVLSVALSWTLIHTLYTLRYARMYFAGPVGGIDFNQDEPPQYTDFAYLAFDLGMTYQVSDTTLRSTGFRREVLKHTLLSYVFGAVILASVINLVAGLSV
ncbi:DUF1345 domain-containing protein [Plantibacter sp. YIM 135249]|uniref:DUF1345 domain-containing protein n=1 Tax=Plantibacter sp. YIM 135249 TaxID=3423918 RepID=UPI003D335E38